MRNLLPAGTRITEKKVTILFTELETTAYVVSSDYTYINGEGTTKEGAIKDFMINLIESNAALDT